MARPVSRRLGALVRRLCRPAMALLLVCAALALPLAGCHNYRQARLYGADEALTAKDYPDILQTWTRSDKVYKNLENKLFVTATFHAPELRRAFAVTFPDLYGHGSKITRRELVDLTGEVEQHHNFFVAVYTPDARWNDLAKNDSIWHLTLRGSSEVVVSAVELIPIKIDENLKAVYPYINRFDKIYLVRFPLADPMHRVVIDSTTTHFTVRMASSLGVAELTWELGNTPRKANIFMD